MSKKKEIDDFRTVIEDVMAEPVNHRDGDKGSELDSLA